jgi:hypothetical protein
MEARLATNKGLLPKDLVDDEREPDKKNEHLPQLRDAKIDKLDRADKGHPVRLRAQRKKLQS